MILGQSRPFFLTRRIVKEWRGTFAQNIENTLAQIVRGFIPNAKALAESDHGRPINLTAP